MDQWDHMIDLVLHTAVHRADLSLELHALHCLLVSVSRRMFGQLLLPSTLDKHLVPLGLVALVVATRRFALAFFVGFVAVVDPVILFDGAFAVASVDTLSTRSGAGESLANVSVLTGFAGEVVGQAEAQRLCVSRWVL